MKIVYVEDNDLNYRLVMRMLTRANDDYTIMRAENGETGLTMIESEKPDLVLMDINLPDIDGMEVTRRIKAKDDLSAIPVVALTANAMVGDQEKIMEAGCDGYLHKPVNRKELIKLVGTYAERRNEVMSS